MLCLISPTDPERSQIGWHPGTFSRSWVRSLSARPTRLEQNGWDFMADAGSPVVAASDGIVVNVARRDDTPPRSNVAPGNYVTVRTDIPGDRPVWVHYWHLAAPSQLVPGQQVRQGDLIGRVGSSGLPSGARPHLLLAVSRFGPDPVRDGPLGERAEVLGFRVEGATPSPVRVGDWAGTPPFGGRFVSLCPASLGDPTRFANRYRRYGATKLSSTSPYDPDGGERTFPWVPVGLVALVIAAGHASARAATKR